MHAVCGSTWRGMFELQCCGDHDMCDPAIHANYTACVPFGSLLLHAGPYGANTLWCTALALSAHTLRVQLSVHSGSERWRSELG